MTRYMWRLPGCGGPWAVFSSGAVEAHFTVEYQNKIYVEAPLVVEVLGQSSVVELWRPTLP